MITDMDRYDNHRVLVVLPHPDDESFGVSGSLAKYVKNGSQVTYACLTLGQMARNMGSPLFANRITLPEIRKEELAQSCRAIGIQDLRMLGFHDKTIEFEERELLDGAISALIEELNPTVIYTFYPGYAVHPDHDATGAAVVRCVENLPVERRPVVRAMAFSRGCEDIIGAPDVRVDVKDFVKQKVASVQSHKSQFWVPELKKASQKDLEDRFGTERFWTLKFD